MRPLTPPPHGGRDRGCTTAPNQEGLGGVHPVWLRWVAPGVAAIRWGKPASLGQGPQSERCSSAVTSNRRTRPWLHHGPAPWSGAPCRTNGDAMAPSSSTSVRVGGLNGSPPRIAHVFEHGSVVRIEFAKHLQAGARLKPATVPRVPLY